MPPRLKPLAEQTIVITGASSGIGLATALAASKAGARVVLTARHADALEQVTLEITAEGGKAMIIAGDVADREHMEHVGRIAIETFGGFDTWINNAGVTIFGLLDHISDADHRRLIDTNFWGVVNGSLVALAHLKQRGGALINLGSVASDLSFPLQGMYCASKHAVRGFTDALRMELDMENAPVSVTLIKPGAINSPLPGHAKNYTGREPMLPPPIYQPEEAAHAILHAASNPVRDIFIGGSAKALSVFATMLPRAMDEAGAAFAHAQLQQRPETDPVGNLHEARGRGLVRGDHVGFTMPFSPYTRAVLHPLATGALAAAAFLIVRGATGRRNARR